MYEVSKTEYRNKIKTICKKEKKDEGIDTKNLLEKNANYINITNSSNADELAQLISKLLNNKTLEITIKIKD